MKRKVSREKGDCRDAGTRRQEEGRRDKCVEGRLDVISEIQWRKIESDKKNLHVPVRTRLNNLGTCTSTRRSDVTV